MSCFWRHRWGKWEFEERPAHAIIGGQKFTRAGFLQKRACARCGLTQLRHVIP